MRAAGIGRDLCGQPFPSIGFFQIVLFNVWGRSPSSSTPFPRFADSQLRKSMKRNPVFFLQTPVTENFSERVSGYDYRMSNKHRYNSPTVRAIMEGVSELPESPRVQTPTCSTFRATVFVALAIGVNAFLLGLILLG
tara:strand:+ start:139 stop:549 length:411 start_codon:yes stop_codon:yes gene_type:complete